MLNLSNSGVSWQMNSRGGQKEIFSHKISSIYCNQIEAFHLGVGGGGFGREKPKTFALGQKMVSISLKLTVKVPDILQPYRSGD